MRMIINRRRYSGKKLPYDAEIEYLESTGTQRIDTGIILGDGTESVKLIFVASLNKANDNRSSLIIATSLPNYGVQVYTYGDNNIANQTTDTIIQLKRKYTFITVTTNTSRSVKVDNDITRVRTFNRRIDDGARLYLFASSDGTFKGSIGLYFSFKVLRNDVLCLDFIPVRVGQVGYMYDKVSGQLFGNSGTGSFILGPDKN